MCEACYSPHCAACKENDDELCEVCFDKTALIKDSANARMVREWIVMDIATLVKLEAAISARRTRLKFARNALMVQHYLKMENVCVVIATKL